jgi:hypothetical protein
MIPFNLSALARLSAALQLPPMTTDLTISIPAGGPAEMTITRLLSEEELDALSDWYVTEGLDRFPTCETTYTLEPRERPEVQS